MEPDTVKAIAPIATPFIAAVVDIFVKPKLEKLHRFLRENKHKIILATRAKFEEYLVRSYHRHSFIPVLIFQNQQRKLDDLYVPLTLRYAARDKYVSYLVDSFRTDFLPQHERVIVRDTAGMGKSTILKKLFLACLESHHGVPIFIELRKLKPNETIVTFIKNELNPINKDLDDDLILDLIQQGDFVFFLDGYDEIAEDDRSSVTAELHDFLSKAVNNTFIMTSRPSPSLASFPSFTEFEIQPLRPNEAYQLLHRYDPVGSVATQIVKKLEESELPGVQEFLTNPLLVSLLFKCYDYKHTIPLKRHIFYRQVFDALFESHDLTKEAWSVRDKASGLDSDSFHAVMRAFAWTTLRRGIEYSKDELLSYLRSAKKYVAMSFSETDLMSDLLQSVPLFTRDGNYYRWTHKSIQDYFASQFIWLDTGERRQEVLRKLSAKSFDGKYSNVLELYFDVDRVTFERTLIFEAVGDYVQHARDLRVPESFNKRQRDFLVSFAYFGTFYVLPAKITSRAGLGSDGFAEWELVQRTLSEYAVLAPEHRPHHRHKWSDGSEFAAYLPNDFAGRKSLVEFEPSIWATEHVSPRKDPEQLVNPELCVLSKFQTKLSEVERSIPFLVSGVESFNFDSDKYLSLENCEAFLSRIKTDMVASKEHDFFSN